MHVPDAPWIRNAELYGMPDNHVPPVYCPCCGWEDPEIIYLETATDVVAGCDHCVSAVDAVDWSAGQEES